MNDAELEHRAAEFWADTDLADAFPRNIEQAIALKLPVTIVKLPIVTIRTIARWLRHHNRSPVLPSYRRDLMGCLYADGGHGFIFVCGADEPEEQGFAPKFGKMVVWRIRVATHLRYLAVLRNFGAKPQGPFKTTTSPGRVAASF